MGRGPPELEDGSINPAAVGVLVQATQLGVVQYADGTFALYATGQAGIIGLGDSIHVEGTLEVKINHSGRTVNETINIPDSGTVDVVFTTPQRVEVFEGSVTLGVGKVGTDYIFKIFGVISFSRNPVGQVQVDVPEASVSINIPDGEGGLKNAFSINGAAKFAFGGGQGFRLQDLRVNGFSIFGFSATITQPAPTLRAPTADLNLPYNGGVFDVQELNDRGYIEVMFNDVNSLSLNEGTITDDTQEFLLTIDGQTPDQYGLTINGRATRVGESNIYRYQFIGTFPEGNVQIKFLPQSFSDRVGTNNVAEIEQFTVVSGAGLLTAAAGSDGLPAPPPTAMLSNPFNGASVNLQSLITRGYIDVTFLVPAGYELDTSTIFDPEHEFALSGAGVGDAQISQPDFVSGTTYRYRITDSNPDNEVDIFTNGEVTVDFLAGGANGWTVSKEGDPSNTIDNMASQALFTVQSDSAEAASSSNDFTIGPLVLEGPSIGLVDMGFNADKLVLTVGIGVNRAALSFGSQQGSSGITAELTGLLGTFDVEVDLLALLGGDILHAFNVPGKFGLKIDGLDINVPNVVKITGAGIEINYDPNYKAEEHDGESQKLLVIDSAEVSFEKFGISGSIDLYNGIPGLTVRENGFQLGQAQLTFSGLGGAGISLAGLIEFDDIRIGIQDFEVIFGQSLDFDGNIYIASGGARFFPGRPISATISDSTSDADDVALSVTLDFENGKVKDLIFDVDTFEITLGSFVTLTGRDIQLNLGAAADEEIVHFGSIGAEVRIGSMLISGEARNFAFLGDGTFVTHPGFGVFLGIGSATGSGFGWPDWMPIKITYIGIEWENIQANPADFTITLSATVSSIKGCEALEFSGTIEGLKIDVGLLLAGKFPIVDIASIGVGIKGDLFGGSINAQLIGGILKVDALGNKIDPNDSTTPVADRIFFAGVQGGFEFAGMGLTIRFALSELGPLGVFINAAIPGGIVVEPHIGLAFNDFSAGVEFFQSLPSIDDPFDLRRPEFGLPTDVTPELWLSQVKDQVVTQYNIVKNNPGLNGFFAAFTSPMVITGSAKIFTIYTSMQVFNGQAIIKLSTDGKILIIGKLNFAADNISITGRLYADLSKIAAGEAAVLFLAEIPDLSEISADASLLSIYGKLKMGLRDVMGQEVEVQILDSATGTPIADLAGPLDGDSVGMGTINNRGYIDVQFDVPTGHKLDVNSILDIAPEFEKVSNGSSFIIPDAAQVPVQINDTTFRYWVSGNYLSSDPISLTFTQNSWFTVDVASGEEVLNSTTAVNVLDMSTVNTGYLDIVYYPSIDGELDQNSIDGDEFSLSGPGAAGVSTTSQLPTQLAEWDIIRYYFTGDFAVGEVIVNFHAGTWADDTGTNIDETESFTVVIPEVNVAGPLYKHR
jgi:hypothetical protein